MISLDPTASRDDEVSASLASVSPGPRKPSTALTPSREAVPPRLTHRTRTLELESAVALARDNRSRVLALIRLAEWCADADRTRGQQVASEALWQARRLRESYLVAKARYAVAAVAVHGPDVMTPYHELLRLGLDFDRMGATRDAAWCDLSGATALEMMGDPGGAVLLVDRAMATFRRLGDQAGQARCFNTIGVGERWVGRHAEAVPLFHRAAELARTAGQPATFMLSWVNTAETYTQLGREAQRTGREELARRLFESAQTEYEPLRRRLVALGYRQLEPQVASLQAVTLLHLGRHSEAVAMAEHALGLAAASNSPESLAAARCHAAEVHLGLGDWARARRLFHAALSDYERWHQHTETARVIEGLVAANESLGDVRAAYAFHKRLLTVELVVRDQQERRQREVNKARVELAASREITGGSAVALADPSSLADGRVASAAALSQANEQLERERLLLERLAHTDAVTGLANRRHFDVQHSRMMVRAELNRRPLGLIIVDIDRFKQINDQYSHVAGDEVLRRVAATLARECRRSDLAARVGGEEFAVLLPGTELDAVMTVAERIRVAARATSVEDVCPGWTVTISAGAAALAGSAVGNVYAAADAALYRAKETGRDRVCAAEQVSAINAFHS